MMEGVEMGEGVETGVAEEIKRYITQTDCACIVAA